MVDNLVDKVVLKEKKLKKNSEAKPKSTDKQESEGDSNIPNPEIKEESKEVEPKDVADDQEVKNAASEEPEVKDSPSDPEVKELSPASESEISLHSRQEI